MLVACLCLALVNEKRVTLALQLGGIIYGISAWEFTIFKMADYTIKGTESARLASDVV